MGLRNKIKKYLVESNQLKILKNYFFKIWQKQVNSGDKPTIDVVDIKRKKLFDWIRDINRFYYEFIGGKEKSYEFLEEYLVGNEFTMEDVRKKGVSVYDGESYIFKVDSLDIDLPSYSMDVYIYLLDANLQFGPPNEVMNLRDLEKNSSQHFIDDLLHVVAFQIEDFVYKITSEFGLEINSVEVIFEN